MPFSIKLKLDTKFMEKLITGCRGHPHLSISDSAAGAKYVQTSQLRSLFCNASNSLQSNITLVM